MVAGGGQGIGRAIALAFASEGARVAVGDVVGENARRTVGEISALGAEGIALDCDVSRREDCDRIVEQTVAAFGGLDVLVNAAAWAQPGTPVVDTTDDLYTRTLDICMSSVFWTCRAAYPHLKESAHPSVINFVSQAGSEGMPGNAPYAAAKEAIRGFSRSLAREWGADGIRVNMIKPVAASPSMANWMKENPKVAGAGAGAEEGAGAGAVMKEDCRPSIERADKTAFHANVPSSILTLTICAFQFTQSSGLLLSFYLFML